MKLQECFFHVNARPLTESEVLCDVLFFLPFHMVKSRKLFLVASLLIFVRKNTPKRKHKFREIRSNNGKSSNAHNEQFLQEYGLMHRATTTTKLCFTSTYNYCCHFIKRRDAKPFVRDESQRRHMQHKGHNVGTGPRHARPRGSSR